MAHIFEDNLPNVSIYQSGENGAFEARWKDGNCNSGDLNASLLRGLSSVYPQWKGFEFSSAVGNDSDSRFGVFSGNVVCLVSVD